MEDIVNPNVHVECRIRHFECENDASNTHKFYEVVLVESGMHQWVLKHWGRIGTKGGWGVEHFDGGGASRAFEAAQKERDRKGYALISSSKLAQIPDTYRRAIADAHAGEEHLLAGLGFDAALVLNQIALLQQDLFSTGTVSGERLVMARTAVADLLRMGAEAQESLAITEKLMVKFA